MSYSCSDFADDVLNDCVRLGLIKDKDIEGDNPQQQSNLVRDGLWREDKLKHVLRRQLRKAHRELVRVGYDPKHPNMVAIRHALHAAKGKA